MLQKVLYLLTTPWLPFSEDFACDSAPGTGSGDVALIHGNFTGADINKTLALGTLLDSDWTAGCFSDSACFVFQAAFVKFRSSRSTSFGVR